MRILFATDDSPGALAGARLLEELPLDSSTVLTLVFVAHGEDAAHARATVADTAAALRHTSATVETRIRHGHTAEEILREAEERVTDLIVLGATGRSALGRFLVGSVTERVARHAPCPVLVARKKSRPLGRILVGVDASIDSARAVRWLASLPLPPGCQVHLLSVVPNLVLMARDPALLTPPLVEEETSLLEWERERAGERLEEMERAFVGLDLQVTTEVRSGDPAAALLDEAADGAADLVVVGSHGTGRLERFFLGSVSENLVRHAHCSVAVVRPAVHKLSTE
jgi:nucleotide-binding universal stress UspA family protein